MLYGYYTLVSSCGDSLVLGWRLGVGWFPGALYFPDQFMASRLDVANLGEAEGRAGFGRVELEDV